jgi:ATP-dependent Lhr-like helicase
LPANEIGKVMLRLEGTGAVLRGRFSDPHLRATEWCERRLLARIHRLTVGKLRKEIEPVSAAQFMRWLLRWQHLTPETQLFSEHGTLDVLRQLQGFEAPANSWERQLLSRRIAGYDPKILDQLCFNGMIGWGRLSPGPAIVDDLSDRSHRIAPTGAAPITFFTRDESDWMTVRQREIDIDRMLSSTAKEVFGCLKERGASFFADVLRSTRKPKEEVEGGLWELVAAGLITADGFDNLRALIDPRRRDLSNGRDGRPRYSAGRWSLLFPAAAVNHERTLEALCAVLLKRYGVVFREVLMRESNLPNWREILLTLRRFEDRGEVRGGRFVSGFLGEQFALPAAVESLRATRAQPPTGETITISAADPLNLVGIVVPGAKVPAISSRFVTYRDGIALEASQPIDYAAVGQAG